MKIEELKGRIEDINKVLISLGLLPIDIVHPSDCLPQAKNARYFKPATFKQLVANVKKYGHLESTPLVYRDGDKYRIISGHHRVQAAKEAGIEWILVFVDNPASRDVVVAKQLAHNALEGKDDPVILAELFTEIADINLKLETGLESELHNVDYSAININLLSHKEVLFLFLPEDYVEVEKKIDAIAEASTMKPSYDVHLAPLKDYDKFIKLIQKTKKAKNIKNNAVALAAIVDFVYNNMSSFIGEQ